MRLTMHSTDDLRTLLCCERSRRSSPVAVTMLCLENRHNSPTCRPAADMCGAPPGSVWPGLDAHYRWRCPLEHSLFHNMLLLCLSCLQALNTTSRCGAPQPQAPCRPQQQPCGEQWQPTSGSGSPHATRTLNRSTGCCSCWLHKGAGGSFGLDGPACLPVSAQSSRPDAHALSAPCTLGGRPPHRVSRTHTVQVC